jgi:hypothetical protein
MQQLYLYENFLSGTIPNELSCLSYIQLLLMQGNYLSGAIPSGLGVLTSVLELLLYDNSLTSTIPASLGSIVGIEELLVNVSYTGNTVQSFDFGVQFIALTMFFYANHSIRIT